MIKTLLPIIFFVSIFFTQTVKAHEVDNGVLVTDWTTGGVASTYVLHTDNDRVIYSEWNVAISTSRGGDTRIYIRVMADFVECDESLLPNVLEVDGRQVSMQPSCNKYSDVEEYFVSFTPATDEGLEYVVESFKNKPSDEWVFIAGFGDALGNIKGFSSNGFTDAYELNRVL